MRHRWLPPLAIASAAFVFFLVLMTYPWQLALLSATAIGAFVYSAQGTWARLRRLHGGRDGLPREDGQRRQQ